MSLVIGILADKYEEILKTVSASKLREHIIEGARTIAQAPNAGWRQRLSAKVLAWAMSRLTDEQVAAHWKTKSEPQFLALMREQGGETTGKAMLALALLERREGREAFEGK